MQARINPATKLFVESNSAVSKAQINPSISLLMGKGVLIGTDKLTASLTSSSMQNARGSRLIDTSNVQQNQPIH